MSGVAKYTTIRALKLVVPIRHMINLPIDRSGASLSDWDVVAYLEEYIDTASRDMDGYLRRYMGCPIVPTLTALTGTLKFTRGSKAVSGVGTAFLSELEFGDEIRPDNAENVRMIIASIASDTALTALDVYYAEAPTPLTSVAHKYVNNVPAEVGSLVRDHVAYMLWARRGTDANNPMVDKEKFFQKTIEEIKRGEFRFETLSDGTIVEKPTRTRLYYDNGVEVKKTFRYDNLKDYTP